MRALLAELANRRASLRDRLVAEQVLEVQHALRHHPDAASFLSWDAAKIIDLVQGKT